MSDANPVPTSDAAAAFDGLRQEVKLLRKAVAAWVDEQHEPPDYTETLGKIAGDLSRTRSGVTWLTQRPALAMTPAEIAQAIKVAGESARTADHKLIIDAKDELERATREFSSWTLQARTAELQGRRLWQLGAFAGAVGLAVGVLLQTAISGHGRVSQFSGERPSFSAPRSTHRVITLFRPGEIPSYGHICILTPNSDTLTASSRERSSGKFSIKQYIKIELLVPKCIYI
ncbi:MAG: DUF6118 family protein [Caulobacteraceae bacterium]